MPWLETNPMDQRLQFLEDVRLGRMSMTALCAHRQISRKTGYTWIARDAEEGRRGLVDRSRAPHHCRTRSRMRWRRCCVHSGSSTMTGARGRS